MKNETAGPDTVRHSHIQRFAKYFPAVDSNQDVLLLTGANCGRAMFTRYYDSRYPFVHKTTLGYALIGPTCLDA